MEKTAKTTYPVHELVSKRWSPRAFDNKPLSKEQIFSLFEAARWAASSYNDQPWRFIYGTQDQPETFGKLFQCLGEFNQAWVKNAPLLIATVTKRISDRTGAENRYRFHDVGLAVGNLSLQATQMGLHLHQMGGFDRDAVRKAFAISDQYEPVSMIAVGYLGKANQLPENLQSIENAPRERKPLSEIVFEGTWKE